MIGIIIWAGIVVLLIGEMRMPRCTCPYRKRGAIALAEHPSTANMVMSVFVWIGLLSMNTLALLSTDRGPLMILFDGVFVVVGVFVLGWTLYRIYWHEYPRVRRLKRRVLG